MSNTKLLLLLIHARIENRVEDAYQLRELKRKEGGTPFERADARYWAYKEAMSIVENLLMLEDNK